MEINVDHIAKLARLGISDAEKELFGKQLAAILEYAANLNKIDTANVPPSSHSIEMKNILREDKAIPCSNVDDILANGPETENHMFKVPRIME